jgi:hypothetical protein
VVLTVDDNATRLSVYLPVSLKNELEEMAKEVGLKQNQLVVLALHSLVKNYEEKGSFIFVDLLNPSDNKKRRVN